MKLSNPAGFCIAVLILVTGLIFLQWMFVPAGLSPRGAAIHFFARQSPGWIVNHSLATVEFPPLFFLVLNYWLRIVPEFSLISLFVFNNLIYFAGLLVFYAWARLLFKPLQSLVLLVFVAFNPYLLFAVVDTRIYLFLFFSICAAAYFASKITLEKDFSFHNWAGWSLFSLFAVYTHSAAIVYVTSMAVIMVWETREHDEIIDCLLAVGAVLSLYLPWALRIIDRPDFGIPRHRLPPSPDFFLVELLIPLFPFLILLLGYFLKKAPGYLLIITIIIYALFVGVAGHYFISSHQWSHTSQLADWVSARTDQDTKIIHVSENSFYPSLFYNEETLPEYLLGEKGVKKADYEIILNWSETKDLLFVLPGPYNILRVLQPLSRQPDYIAERTWDAGEYRILHFYLN